ncbi:hypothetical protein RJ55_02188 [Drechmeria coniospora]|nr:hypothetical protein RJ55_02188 [Drechmeria coniospora]
MFTFSPTNRGRMDDDDDDDDDANASDGHDADAASLANGMLPFFLKASGGRLVIARDDMTSVKKTFHRSRRNGVRTAKKCP